MRGLDASSTSRVARVGGCKVVCRPSKNNLLEASVGKSYLVVGYRFAPSKERVPVPWTHVAYVPTGFDRPQPLGRKRTRRVSPFVFAGNVGDFLIGLN